MQVRELSREAYEAVLEGLGVTPPVEQLPVWQDYEATIPGRSPWGFVAIEDGGAVVAAAALTQYETHGYRYLRAHHAPVWSVAVGEPSAEQEAAVLDALVDFVRGRDKRQVFMRLAVDHELPQTRPCLSTLPYDTTVVIDVTGSEDDILSRMKPRGRRDVRKSLRECPCALADETDAATADFAPYYEIMRETGERDGFTPAPLSDFQDMVRILGPKHARVYAGRNDGELVAWSLVTVSGGRATRYYAATAIGSGRLRVADALLFFECERVAELGCSSYDLMGIGSAFSPETMNLNEFKTKFAKDGVVRIAPDRDVPVKRGFYGALVKVRDLRNGVRARRAGAREKDGE